MQLNQHQSRDTISQHSVSYSNQQQLHHPGYSISMESEEGDIEDNRAHSLSSSKSNLSDNSMVSVTSECNCFIIHISK